MTEFKVWRSIVDWVEDMGGIVYAACPPGSSVYDYRKFCIIDPLTKKRDEPDILLSLGGILYFIECKPTLSNCLNKSTKLNNNESDIEKLLRIKQNYDAGNYDNQLLENYGVDCANFKMEIAIGYAINPNKNHDYNGITQFIVSPDDMSVVIKNSGT